MAFVKAIKEKLNGRIALDGPSGGGKSMTALRIGMSMLPVGGRMAVIDTERGSARKYVGEYGIDFDVIELDSFEPQKYVAAIREAAAAKYPVLVIDSASHAWSGKGGLLEQVDDIGKRNAKGGGAGNSFAAWKQGTPIQNEFIDTMLGYPGHIIITMRTKTEYVLETVNGKQVPRKVGMAPIQRDGMEYEFDIFADISIDHDMIITKTRCSAFVDAIIHKAGEDFGHQYLAWLNSGADRVAPPVAAPTVNPLRAKLIANLADCATAADIARVRAELTQHGGKGIEDALTGIDGVETFKSLLTARWNQIKPVTAPTPAASPVDPIPDFLARARAVSGVEVFRAMEAELAASAVLSDHQPCIDAMNDAAKDLGLGEGV